MNFKNKLPGIPLCLVVLVFVINIPYLKEAVIPIHDTARIYTGFHFFYSQLYFDDIINWIKSVTYRSPNAYFQLIFLTPSCYAVMLIGKLLNVSNALSLFKISIIVDQLIFLIGFYCLCEKIFTQKIVIFFVCAGAVLCIVWHSQLWWNFRFYYLIPMIIYCLLTFFEKGSPFFLWLTGITFVISLLGNLPCFGIVWGVLLIIIMVVMSFNQPHTWKTVLSKSSANIFPFLTLLLLSIGYFLFVLEAAKTSPPMFFLYGERIDAIMLLRMFVLGWPIHTDWTRNLGSTVYIGLPPLLLCLYALVNVRHKILLIFSCFLFFLIWFSSSGILAVALSYIPGLSVPGNFCLMNGFIKIVVLVCAGFGLERATRHFECKHFIGLFVLVVFLADHLVGDTWFKADSLWSDILIARMGIYFGFLLIVLLSNAVSRIGATDTHESNFSPFGKRFLRWSLMICYIVDLLLFQFIVYSSVS